MQLLLALARGRLERLLLRCSINVFIPQTDLSVGVLAVLVEGRWSSLAAPEPSKRSKLLYLIGQTRCHLQKHTVKLIFLAYKSIIAERRLTFKSSELPDASRQSLEPGLEPEPEAGRPNPV